MFILLPLLSFNLFVKDANDVVKSTVEKQKDDVINKIGELFRTVSYLLIVILQMKLWFIASIFASLYLIVCYILSL